MATILKKERLAERVYRYRLHAPRIAAKRRAGQFIILRPVQNSERIPLTIANGNAAEGWIEIIFQTVGRTTILLAMLNEGDTILDVVGPLGKPTHIENFGRTLCIGGGVGIAPLYPIMRALRESGNHITSIIGARSRRLLILESEIREQSHAMHIATDDGSAGIKGFVSDVFRDLAENRNELFDAAFIVGPAIMMKVSSALTVKAGIRTFVSLNPIMIDGTGMCGGCRITIGGKTKFACVDGPEFDAALVDWDELAKRLNSYRAFEEASCERPPSEPHACKLEEVGS
jgi:NAD(P)H-flavin reductase